MVNATFHESHHVTKEVRTGHVVCVFCHACSCHRPLKMTNVCSAEYSESPEYRDPEAKECGHLGCDRDQCSEVCNPTSYKYHDLNWAGLFQRRCKSKFGTKYYRGSCELKPRHEGDHAAERGMHWVRWNDHAIWFTTPGAENQNQPKEVE